MVVIVGVVVVTVGVSSDCYYGCGGLHGGCCFVGAQGQDVSMGVVVVTTVALLVFMDHRLLSSNLYENSLHVGVVTVTMGFEWCSGCGCC